MEDENEHDILTLDDVIAAPVPSPSSSQSALVPPTSASPQKKNGAASTASLLAELHLVQPQLTEIRCVERQTLVVARSIAVGSSKQCGARLVHWQRTGRLH